MWLSPKGTWKRGKCLIQSFEFNLRLEMAKGCYAKPSLISNFHKLRKLV